MEVAHIYQVAKKSTQSGKGSCGEWRLRFPPSVYQEHLMKWVGSRDTQSQVHLSFPTREAAERYAQEKGIEYLVSIEDEMDQVLKSYSDNFRRP